MNSVQIAGRLTRDPELKYTQGGMAVANFTVAVSRYKKGGEESTDFINCVAFSRVAELLAEKTVKGGRVLVEGSIKTGKYEHKDGHTVYTTDVNAYKVSIIDWANDNQRGSSAGDSDDMSPNFDDMTPIDDNNIPF